jgi:hypothetical protein
MMGEPFDPALLGIIRRELASIDVLQSRRIAALQGPLVDRSPAARDALLPDARFVTIYAGQATQIAIDHLLAWRLIAHSPLIPTAAHLTLLRAAIENADRSRWLLDTKLRSGKRVGRAIAARRADQEERAKFEAAKGPGPRPPVPRAGFTAVQRLAQLDSPDAIRRRSEAGIEHVGDADIMSVIQAFGHERWYRIASGRAHGREWSMIATTLDAASKIEVSEGIRAGQFSAGEAVTTELTRVAVRTTEAAVAALERYFTVPVGGRR